MFLSGVMKVEMLLASVPDIQDLVYDGFFVLSLSVPVISLVRLFRRRSKETERLTTLRKVADEYACV